jgi:2-amino-4-hydroxy-6-hydroxymethyldihydropteridine diphosphokinase
MIADSHAITTAYIGLGSNLGDRARALFDGVRLILDAVPARARLSPLYVTAPVDFLDQPDFLNGVLEIAGPLPSPHDLLDTCLRVEGVLGRERTVPKGPRTLDLDLLLYGEETSADDRLVLPHPRLHLRRFALEPLADLAPNRRHPVLGLTMTELLARLRADEQGG